MNDTAAAPPRHPATELLARYKAIFGAAWAARHQLAGPTRLADEAAFLLAALSLQDTPAHPAPRRLAMAIMALFVIALVWSIVGQVDIVAVAPGRIVVSQRTKVVQPLERSVVKRVLVQDGDRVEAGQALVELDPTSAHADKTSVDEQLKSAQSELLRSRALLQVLLSNQERSTPAPPAQTPDLAQKLIPAAWTSEDRSAAQTQLAAEWSDIAAKLARAAAETARRQAEIATVRAMVAKLEATLPIARQREADFRQLADQGFMSSHAIQDRTRERIELERDLATQRARLVEANAALAESQNSRAAYLAETRRTLREREAKAELQRTQGTQEQAKASQRERLTTLTAPVSGTVARFDTGIAADQLWFTRTGNNLDVSIIGTADKFTINNWYLGSQYHVEQFKTSDGKVLLDSQVQNLVQAMAVFSPPAAGQTTLPANYQSSLNTVIAANWH